MANTTRIVFRLLVFSLLSMSLWIIAGSIAKNRQTKQSIPVKITKQLDPLNNVIPAEIRCGTAQISATNELEFSCKLKNNSIRNITAAGVTYSVVIEADGVEARDEYSSVFVSLAGPQFQDVDKVTAPKEERSIGPSGPIFYADAVIKRVEIGIDYVEFEDSIAFGEGGKGSQVVKDFREGAVKYKNWLTRKYKENAKSAISIAPLLDSEEALPNELGLLNQDQQFGAKAYRKILKKKFNSGNYSELEKLLISQ